MKDCLAALRFRRTAPARSTEDVSKQRGFALLIVLWTLVLITLVVSQLGATGRSETRLSLNLRAAQAAQDVADGALQQAILRLMQPGPERWIADGRSYELRVPGGIARVTATDEAGRINPNTASIELLRALLQAVGADAETAASVARNLVDWRFPNDRAAALPAEYAAAGRSYAPPQAPLQTVDEIGLVLGVTPALRERLAPHLTVWHEGDPDPALADPIVLRAIKAQSGAALTPPTADQESRFLKIVVTGASSRQAVVLVGGGEKAGLWRIVQE